MNKVKSLLPKGFRDFNTEVMRKRNFIFQTVQSVFECYGYSQIQTPAIEDITCLTGNYGDEGDRLIFKILNSGDFLKKIDFKDSINSKDLSKKISKKALRYDLTVPFARFVSQNRNDLTFPFKRYQMQNVWRADRPQRGRFREFYQCDVDIVGTDSLLCEIELIQIYDEVFTKLGIRGVDICINNRKLLSGILEIMNASDSFNDVVVILDKIDSIGMEKAKDDLNSIGLNAKSISILDKFLNAENLNDIEPLINKSEIGLEGFKELKFVMSKIKKLKLSSANLKFDVKLARGLSYYTGCIFEVKNNNVKIGSIGGGGRYDNLTSNFGLNNMSGVGISFGLDRIFIVMEELNLFSNQNNSFTQVMFMNFGDDSLNYCLALLKKLRDKNIRSEIYPSVEKIKKQMNYANNLSVKYVVFVGEDEINSEILTVKEMSSGNQSQMNVLELIKKIQDNE